MMSNKFNKLNLFCGVVFIFSLSSSVMGTEDEITLERVHKHVRVEFQEGAPSLMDAQRCQSPTEFLKSRKGLKLKNCLKGMVPTIRNFDLSPSVSKEESDFDTRLEIALLESGLIR